LGFNHHLITALCQAMMAAAAAGTGAGTFGFYPGPSRFHFFNNAAFCGHFLPHYHFYFHSRAKCVPDFSIRGNLF
jgi:hypothetical protein